MIKKIIELLSGRKMFLTGIVMIILGCLQDFDQVLIFGGLTLITGKSALKKLEN